MTTAQRNIYKIEVQVERIKGTSTPKAKELWKSQSVRLAASGRQGAVKQKQKDGSWEQPPVCMKKNGQKLSEYCQYMMEKLR